MSFSLLLDSANGYANTAGIDYSWNFDFSAVALPGPYEMTFCFYSKQPATALADFSTQPNPHINLDLFASQQKMYIPGSITIQNTVTGGATTQAATTKFIGIAMPLIVTNTIGCFQSSVNANPPVHFSYIPTSGENQIRVFLTTPGLPNIASTSVTSFSMVLYFRHLGTSLT